MNMYLTPTEDHWVIDIETEKLEDPKQLWVMCYENAVTSEKGSLTDGDAIVRFFESHPGATYIGHNIVKFDAPTLNRLLGTKLGIKQLVDTLVLSNLYNPNLEGGHSLEAWGKRFGLEKIQFDAYEIFSDEMVTYCERDVELTKMLYVKLAAVLKKIEFSEKSCEIQHKITSIINRQRKNGFAFNAPEATTLRAQILKEVEELTELIHVKFPPVLVLADTYKKAFKQDGTFSAQYERHLGLYPVVELAEDGSGAYSVYAYKEFNIASPAQRVEKLLSLGWTPEEFTPKTPKGGGGNPRPTIKGELSPSLARFAQESGVEEVALIAQWLALNGRATMLGTWLDEYNPDTGCIHGQLWPASTLRWRHDHPNTANIPAVRHDKEDKVLTGRSGYYTYEARALWVPRSGDRVLVGTDASALEYRMLAHHVNNKELIDVVLSRDVHQFTADMAGVDRNGGKTLNFAIIYGAGDAKAGSVVGGKAKEGKLLKEKLFANIPGLGEAIQQAKDEYKRGRITLVDGSKIICPQEHASFNYKLQGGGARVMFQAAIFLEQHIWRKGLDSLKVGDIHDEWQYDVAKEDAEEHASLARQALVEAGEELNMNIPMDGKSIIGLNWAETH
jgi:DNA polymerase I-like protein with 3'-5' exonuclease and polymerase domains